MDVRDSSGRYRSPRNDIAARSRFALFHTHGRWGIAVVALFAFVNGLVLFNAVRHDPLIAYDAEHHLRYVRTFAFEGTLPTRGNSREFFSPPAPYVVPAIVARLLGDESAWSGGKAGQLVNALASIGLTLALLRLCELARPGDARFKALALLALAMLPVYYKSFAMLRGEPLLACFATLATVQFVRIVVGDASARRAIVLGALLSLCILSRQWGFFLFPAFALAGVITWRFRTRDENKAVLRCAAVSGAVALLVGGWFYGLLYARYNTLFAFNRPPAEGALLSTQPASFYTSLHARELLTQPTRGAFPNRFLPIFYSETWGDYWGYFISSRYGPATSTDGYLGRVNALSIVPTLLLLSAAGFGVWRLVRVTPVPQGALLATCGAVIVCTAIGYGWFLLRYPTDDGDTIKATYVLHAFPLLAILSAAALSRLRGITFWACVVIVLLVAAHNVPAMVTRYAG